MPGTRVRVESTGRAGRCVDNYLEILEIGCMWIPRRIPLVEPFVLHTNDSIVTAHKRRLENDDGQRKTHSPDQQSILGEMI